MFLAHRRAMRGVELLDREVPGWAQFIDVETLDIAEPDRCVLGQLYSGEYEMGEAALFSEHGRPYRHTAKLARRHGLRDGLFSWNTHLTEEWALVVNRRQYEAMSVERACPALTKASVPARRAP